MDPTSGYRAINREVIQIFAHNYPKDYPEPEVLIHLKRKIFALMKYQLICKKDKVDNLLLHH